MCRQTDRQTDRQETTLAQTYVRTERPVHLTQDRQSRTQADNAVKTKSREEGGADLPVPSEYPARSHDQQNILQSLGHRFTELFVAILGAVLQGMPCMYQHKASSEGGHRR